MTIAKRSHVMKRRCLLVFLLSIALFTIPALAQDTDPPPPVVTSHITGDLYYLLCNDASGMIASIGGDGTLLVDTGFAGTAEAVAEELPELGGGPARLIVNTHSHGDHVGGNAILGEKAVIIAHPNVRNRMERYFALPALETGGSPMVTVTEDTTIHFNGEAIHLIVVPGGHTASDLVVHFTQSGVACVGDLAFVGNFANAHLARGGNAPKLAEVLRELHHRLPAETTLIAAHGGTFTMEDFATYIEMVEGTVAAVAAEIEAGRTLQEIIEDNPLEREPWTEWDGPDGPTAERWATEIHGSLAGTSQLSICAPVTEALVEDGVDAAVACYRKLKAEEPESWDFGEDELNQLGYQLLARDRTKDAIVIFELNVEAYPDGFNTYDSLGEAFMIAGKNEAAIANYERSLELNPDNANAVTMLTRLRGE
jgi:glyoxylase-like metal-dependent hydrolase (beta-lactamase superfamily II)